MFCAEIMERIFTYFHIFHSVKAETVECLVARDSIVANRDFSCTFCIIQIYFSDSDRFLCVNAYFGASIHLILFFVSKPKKKCGIYKCTNKICRFEIIDGVKYVYCIKHAYISSERTVRVYGRSVKLASMGFLCLVC